MSEPQPGDRDSSTRPPADQNETAEPDEALAGVVARLRDELAGMRRAMLNRAVIEQAKGVLIGRLGVGPDAAFDQLVQLSQRANIKLAEVSAALVGATAPAPDAGHTGGEIDDMLRALASGGTTGQPAADPATEVLRSQHHLLAARITASGGYPQIAATIAAASAGWPAPDSVLLALRGPSDELRHVGGHGDDEAGTLTRVGTEAYTGGTPVWRADTGEEPLRSALAVPLTAGTETLGVLVVGWATPTELSAEERRYLTALAEPIGRRIDQLAPADVAGDTDDPVRLVLNSIPTPAALLSAIRDDEGRVVDFRYSYTNTAAAGELTELVGPNSTDRTLLAVFPETGSRLLLAEFAAVLTDGTHRELADVRSDTLSVARISAARIGDRLLVVWQPHSEADLLFDQLLAAERIGRLGSFWWRLDTGEARFTPELYRLLGRDPERGAVPLTDAEEYVHVEDRDAVAEALRAAADGRGFTVEHRLSDAPGRRLRISGEPEFDPDGTVASIRGTVQDITAERAVESRLRRAQEALASQRQQLRAESTAAETLRQALLPTDPELTATPGISVLGLCRSPESTGLVAGDWYDVFALAPTRPGDGLAGSAATYLVVGDVTGNGLTATVAAARLRNAIRGYAVLGMAPGELLTALNQLVAALSVDQLATLVVARFDPDARQLRWAAAGQAAPLHYTADGHPAVLTGPLGLPVGVTPDIGYEETTVDLAPGDRVLLYTDGLVVRRDRTLAAGLDALLRAGGEPDLPTVVDRVSATLDAAPDDDLALLSVLLT